MTKFEIKNGVLVGFNNVEGEKEFEIAPMSGMLCDRANWTNHGVEALGEDNVEILTFDKGTAREILTTLIKKAKDEIDFQDGTVNTQLEPLYLGLANGVRYMLDEIIKLAKKYGVEVEE